MEDDSSSSPPGGDDNNTEMSENDTSSIVPDVIPLEDYNIKKSKLKASLKWMVAKAYTTYEPPPDLKEPFFQDAEGEEHLKPSVIYQLASSELYSMASTNVFPPTLHQWQGHWSIIQGLSRKGVYVVDDKEQPVTETVLAQTQRIKLSAHLAMMDAIQRAYVAEVASIEKVVQAVRQFSTFSASNELPFDVEDGLLFWMNKVSAAVRHKMEKERRTQQDNLMQGSPQKVRIRREQLQAKDLPSIPVMDDLMKDLGDGCSLAVLLHFYFPHLMSLDDLSLQDPMSFAESIHNLGILEEFFQQHLPQMYPFKPEDLLYSPACLKSNVLAMLGELFYTCEVTKPHHLKQVQEQENKSVVTKTPDTKTPDSISSKLPPLPISSATKKSFQTESAANLARNTSSNPELNKIGATTPLGQQPLQPKRHRQLQGSLLDFEDDSLQSQLRRATSLDNIELGKRSFIAWQKPEERLDVAQSPIKSSKPIKASVGDSQASSLLTNVSLDSDLGQSMTLDELGESQNTPLQSHREVESRPGTYAMPNYADEDDLEVESLTSALSRVSRASKNAQPQSLDGAPAVASASIDSRQSQYNGTKEGGEPRQEAMRLDSIDQPSESASYVGESQSSLGYLLGGSGGSGHEQVEHPNNFHRKKLTLDIQPVPIGQHRGRHHQEKLMPAVVRPLKEKSQNANKQEERGVLSQSRSPRQTSWGGSGKQEDNILSPELEPTTPLSPESIADSLASDFSQSQRNKDSVSQQQLQQQQQQQQQSQPPKGQFSRVPFQPLNQNISQEPQMTSKNKHGEAFYIHANPDQNMQYQDNVVHDSVEATRPHPTSSFTIVDKQYTVESAQQAGIPVVGTSMDGQRSWSHPPMESGGGGGSPRIMQSNSFSHPTYPNHMHSPHHHIVQSYHSPSHSHNSSPMHTPPPLHTPPPSNPHYPNPHYPNPHHSPQHSSPRRSPLHHYPMQHTSPQSPHHGHLPHNPQYAGHGGGSTNLSGGRVELTRFGNTGHGAPSHHHNNQEPLAVGLAQVRLRLEEKRRNMEKEKRTLERHWTKQRQRVGKAAFLQVLATQKQAKETKNVVEEGTLARRPYSREEIERSLDEAQNRWLEEPSNQGKTTFAALSAHKEKSSGSIHSRDSDSPQGGRSDSPSSVVDMRSKGSPSSSESHSPPPQLTPEQYNVSLDKMNENMSQLMREIQKISQQQEQLKSAMESPRSAKESPRQATKPTTGRQLSSSSSGSDAPGFTLHGGGGGGSQTAPDNQPFFLGTTTPSPPGPPPVESDNEPFVLQENPLFSMSEQMSPPSGGPVGGQPGQSPQGSPREGHNTYVVQKRKARPKLDMTATESLASKRGQQIAPVETNVTTDAPVTSDNQDKSPEGFRLHGGDSEPETAEMVQVNDYKAPVGFEIVDDVPKSTPKKRPQQQKQPPQQKQPEQRVPRQRTNSSGSLTKSPTKKRPPSVYEIVGETEGQEEDVEQMVVKPLDESQHEIDDSGDSKVLGFVVAEEKNEEDEIAKKREQFLRSRLKKQEAEKAKKAAREAQAEKLKEEHRRKQDEIEAKKAKEIERREKIRLAYQKRKQKEQDEQDGGPPHMREKKSSRTKSRPRSRVIDENTDFAKPTISSGPPAVSAQDVAEANMPISKQKTSFTISSNGQSERNGGGATERMNSGHTTPTQSIKSSPSATTTPTTAPAGVPSGAVKATSPEKPPSVPDAVRRRPPSPRVRPKQNGTKLKDSSPTKAGPSPTASGPPSEAMGSVRSDDTQSTTAPSVVSQNSDDSGSSGPPEYTGPKLYVKPASKSNRHIITNAIAHCVLAGAVNQGNKDKVLQEVAKSDFKHYVLLFRNTGLQFRGLYGYSPDSDEISKIYGTGPRHITGKMIEGLYKYSSGNKSFSKIPSKTMSVQIDGITIANHLWQSKKPSTKKH